MDVQVSFDYEPSDPNVGILADGWQGRAEFHVDEGIIEVFFDAEYGKPIGAWPISGVAFDGSEDNFVAVAGRRLLRRLHDAPNLLPSIQRVWSRLLYVDRAMAEEERKFELEQFGNVAGHIGMRSWPN